MNPAFVAIFTQWAFIWIAFLLGMYEKHLREACQGLLASPGDWRWIAKGMARSKTFFVFGLMIAMSVAVFFFNVWQIRETDRAVTEAYSLMRNIDLKQDISQQRILREIDDISTSQDETNQKIQDLTGRIDKLLSMMEANSGTGK